MADLSIKLGDIFLVNTPIKPHYFIAIAETGNNKYLFVSVITKKPKSELACVIKPKEIQHGGIQNTVKTFEKQI